MATPMAVICAGEELGKSLTELLDGQGLRVIRLLKAADVLPILEKPDYVFFFTASEISPSGRVQFSEALASTARAGGRMILILDNVSEKWAQWGKTESEKVGWPVTVVELRGGFGAEGGKAMLAKLMRLAFAGGMPKERTVYLGSEPKVVAAEKGEVSSEQVWERINQWEEIKRKRWRSRLPKIGRKTVAALVVLLAVLILVVTPVAVAGAYGILGFSDLMATKTLLEGGKFTQAGERAEAARGKLVAAENVVRTMANWWGLFGSRQVVERYYGFLSLGELAAEAAKHVVTAVPKVNDLTNSFLNGAGGGVQVGRESREVVLELAAIDRDLGLAESQIREISPTTKKWMGFFGWTPERVERYQGLLPQARTRLQQLSKALTVLPEAVGVEGGSTVGALPGRRTYLVVFQNSTELRPTGGFIGSYAIVHFDSGKLLDYKVNDIYTADGQLVGRIAPPDELLHYLGQPNWYMRDANWAADWPLTAKRLEWFLEKETGQQVDGVVAVSLPAVGKVLVATGPLDLPDLGETVTADNFYQKAEYAAEINFFPGSTQKRDYIGAVTQAILDKVTTGVPGGWLSWGQALSKAVAEKDILFYFNSPKVQQVFADNGWAGSMDDHSCDRPAMNCLMVVEANLGANKANYFVKRAVRVRSIVDKGGGVENTVTVNLENNSPSPSWPGGRYKAYLRFLVPTGSRFEGMDIGDGRTATVSATLTAQVLAGVAPDRFLVFQSPEPDAVDQPGQTGSWVAYGALVDMPIQTERTIVFRYVTPYRVVFNNQESSYRLVVLKQPGMGKEPLDVALDYPAFLTAEGQGDLFLAGAVPVATAQRLVYNSDLSTDRVFEVKFQRAD